MRFEWLPWYAQTMMDHPWRFPLVLVCAALALSIFTWARKKDS